MRDKFATLSGVGLAAMAMAAVAVPTAAQAADGSVTLSAEQWQAIQQQMAQDHKDIEQLKAALKSNTQQATQAQATATEAKETAKKADEKASTSGGALAKAAAWAADTKISGRMYFNVSTISAHDYAGNSIDSKKGGGFELKRFYIGIDHKFNSVLSGNITTDVTAASGSGAQLYVKKAYLSAKFSPALDVRLGATDLPWIPYVEGIYGHRYIENTLTDLDHFGTSSDWGVHVQGKLANGLINYQVSAVNGAGYKTIKMTKSIDFEGRLALEYHGFNAAIGGYTGKLGKDDGSNTIYHTANRFNALLAYKGDLGMVPFTIGGEYFHAKNWNNVTGSQSFAAGGLLTDDVTSEGYSIFASVKPLPKIGVFGRYDWVKPDKEFAPLQTEHYFNVGIEYSPAKIVDLALVYKRDKGNDNVSIGHLSSSMQTRDEFGLYSRFRW
jgi:hypothetical protein